MSLFILALPVNTKHNAIATAGVVYIMYGLTFELYNRGNKVKSTEFGKVHSVRW